MSPVLEARHNGVVVASTGMADGTTPLAYRQA